MKVSERKKTSQEKGCEIVGKWLRSTMNHLYWSVISTEDNNVEEMLEKWLSLVNHMHNVHRGHGQIYKNVVMVK